MICSNSDFTDLTAKSLSGRPIGGEKLMCNGNKIILLFPVNNVMPYESIIKRVIVLLAWIAK